jgi:uncharacterized protein YbjT (DUF2867 family)
MKLVVTGGSGFLGRYAHQVVALRRGHQVVAPVSSKQVRLAAEQSIEESALDWTGLAR